MGTFLVILRTTLGLVALCVAMRWWKRRQNARQSRLICWFAADRITGLSDGDRVAVWPDLSGNGNHAVQAR